MTFYEAIFITSFHILREYYRQFYGFQPTFSNALMKGYILVLLYLLLEIFLMKVALRRAKRTGLLLKLSE